VITWVGDKELGDQAPGLAREPRGELEMAFEDLGVHVHQILILKWKKPSEKNV
jgi:hypothetical protein